MANELAYGFVQHAHLAKERVTTVGVRVVIDAIRESADEHTRQLNAMLGSMVRRTTDHQIQFRLPGSGTLQPLDENGNPRPVREEGHYTVAFPIQGGGTAWGTNRVSRALMTLEEANVQTIEAMRRDANWMRRHYLAALLDNVAWTFTDEEFGNLTVEPLANGDAVTYVRVGGAVATDTHYLAQAGAIADAANPFPTIYDELMEHPSNTGPVVVYIATSLVDDVTALTAFVPVTDPDIVLGVATDRLGAMIERGIGDEVLGKVDNCWVVEWRGLPAGYMVAHAQGAGPAVAMREYASAALQGFFPETSVQQESLEKLSMIRYAGFGVENRIAALVYFVGAGAYAIPAGYDAPLAV
jgi:hypothetical protein